MNYQARSDLKLHTLKHNRVILGYIRQVLGSSGNLPDAQESFVVVPVQCQDQTVSMCHLVLASLSPVLKSILKEMSQTGLLSEALIIAPDLFSEDVKLFNEFLLNCTEDISSNGIDFEVIGRVTESLEIPKDVIPYYDIYASSTPNDFSRDSSVVDYEEGVDMATSLENNDEEDGDGGGGGGGDKSKVFVRNACGTGNIKCHFCDKKYHQVKARNKHMLSEHLDECKRKGFYYPCPNCDLKFTSLAGMSKHSKRLHANCNRSAISMTKPVREERVRCPFEQGERSFKSLKELRSHVKESHGDKERSCILCGQDFHSKDDLFQHIQNHQGPEARFLYCCEHCQLKFISEYALLKHKIETHSSNQVHSCHFCGKTFRNAKFLQYHEQKHKDGDLDAEFKCEIVASGEICNKTFANKHHLDRHIRSYHLDSAKKFDCDLCGKQFVDSTRLKQHKWIHSGYLSHKCDKCGKGFRHISHLKRHQVQFHGEKKKFGCTLCDKRFIYAYQLKTHMNKHDLKSKEPQEVSISVPIETAYQCSFCQEVFQDYDLFQNHRHLDVIETSTSSAPPQNSPSTITFVPNASCNEFHMDPSGSTSTSEIVLQVAPSDSAKSLNSDFVIVYEDKDDVT